MRIPAVISAFVTLFAGGKLVWYRYRDKRQLFLFTVLMTVTPYFIYSGRFGFDCNLFLMMSTIFLLFFEKARCERKMRQWVAAGIIGGVMLYSYALSWIVLPIFFILSLGWLLWTKQIRLVELCAMGIPLFMLALPLLLFNAVNAFGLDSIHLGRITIPRIGKYRSGLFFQSGEGYGVVEKAVTLFRALFIDSGDVYPVVMPLYWTSIPFFCIGLWRYFTVSAAAVKEKGYVLECTMLLWLAAQCVMGVCIDIPTTYRLNGAFFVILLMVVEGVRCAFESIWDGRKGVLFFSVIAYFILFISFGNQYYTVEDQGLKPLAYYSLDEVDQKVLDEVTQKEQGTKVYIYTNDNWCSYVYYLAANGITPEEFAQGGASRLSWNHVFFDFPDDEIDPDAIYVIMEGLEAQVDELYSMGMTVKKLEHYYIVWQN
ncbi:MAG: glycosyltransferase family 39 protein [bacterium]|nr:glycosyltransferase family 39 protein [bacterium]